MNMREIDALPLGMRAKQLIIELQKDSYDWRETPIHMLLRYHNIGRKTVNELVEYRNSLPPAPPKVEGPSLPSDADRILAVFERIAVALETIVGET